MQSEMPSEFLKQLSEERLGVIALGSFVGVLLAIGLLRSGPTLKTVLTVIGAALGGAPVLFLSGTAEKWLYPIALLIAFCIGATIQALFNKRTVSQAGIIKPTGFDIEEIFYSIPFATTPSLTIDSKSTYTLPEQRADGFKIKFTTISHGDPVKWLARGKLKKQ